MSKSKQYVVTRTVEYRDKDGKTQIIKPSKNPQPVPAALVKELQGKGVIIDDATGNAILIDEHQPDSDGAGDGTQGGAGDGAGGE